MTFQLPESLPSTVSELDELLDQALAAIRVHQARYEAGEKLGPDDVVDMNRLSDAAHTITEARDAAHTVEERQAQELAESLQRAEALLNPPAAVEPEPAAEVEPAEPVEAEPEAEPETVEGEVVMADGRPVNFAGVGAGTTPDVRGEAGWEVDPSCPGWTQGMGRVKLAQLARMIDSANKGSRTLKRPNKAEVGAYQAQTLARLHRNMPVYQDMQALVAAIDAETDERKLPGGSLIASMERALTAAGAGGGWCAPSEQLYDFCDVPNASDLISLPDFAISRGGIRWPNEPDLTTLFEDFEWFFTEVQMEAVDSGTGEPSAVKTCVDIPCPDEFTEIRLAAVGYCVEAGILQTQGWPELITWFTQSLAQEHLRAMSRRTILDIVDGSTAHTIADANLVGVVPAVLNAMAFRAATLRLNRGLPRNATIEAIAPAWLFEAMRADLAMRAGIDTLAVSDGQLVSMFTARNIAVQWVGDWQSRGTNEVGNLANLWYPATVQVAMYPAGTWFRSLSPIIELGVQYPKELLQVNRYTRFFTEDAIAVFKRCNVSEVNTIPICVSGGYGGPVTMACEST